MKRLLVTAMLILTPSINVDAQQAASMAQDATSDPKSIWERDYLTV